MYLNKFILVILLTFNLLNLFAQSTTDIFKQVSPEKQLDYILENIYQIRTTNMDTALHYITYAIELSQRIEDKQKEAQSYKIRGVIYYYLGEFEAELADPVDGDRVNM